MTLKEVSKFIVDSEHKTAPTQETGYPSIRTSNIGRGRLKLDGVQRVSEEVYRKWTRRAVPQEDDLILAREAPVGNVGIVLEGMKVCLGQRTVLIRPDKDKVDPSYLTYLLLSRDIQGRFHALSTGSTVPHLNLSDLRSFSLPDLPPLYIQRRIAEILSAYDDLIENNRRRIELLEEMAQAVYREWFVEMRFPGHENATMRETETLGPVPEGWEVVRLGDLAESPRNRVKPQEEVEPDVPYFGLGDLPKKSIALSEWGRAEDAGSTKYTFNRGDILFGKIRPYFHKVGPAPVAGICSTDAIVIRPFEPMHFGIVLGCVSSEEFVAHATQTSSGTKMPRAKWKILKDHPVVVPPTSLLQQFDKTMRTFVEQIHTLIHKNKTLRRTRDFLLPRLVSGEVEVNELPELEVTI